MAQENFAVMNQKITLERSAAGIASAWNDVPYGPHPTSDGWVAIAMCPLDRLAELLEDPELAGMDPWEERDSAKLRIDDSTRKLTTQELLDVLGAADVWCAPVRSTDEALEDARTREPHRLVEMDHPKAGKITTVANPIYLSETPVSLRQVPPQVGEHTEEVIVEVLGQDRLAELRESGALG